jgi:hypothetical protein
VRWRYRQNKEVRLCPGFAVPQESARTVELLRVTRACNSQC